MPVAFRPLEALRTLVRKRQLPAGVEACARAGLPAQDGTWAVETVPPLPSSAGQTRIPPTLISFVILAVVPALLAALYLIFLAAPEFATESRLVVRTAETQGTDALGTALATLSSPLAFSTQTQNAQIVANYIRSRAVVDDILGELDLRQVFRRPEADFWARLDDNATIEQLVKYWRRMVHAYVDGPSGIIIVEVRAFTPQDSLQLSNLIVRFSERLVNEISRRARTDVLKSSEDEVRRADEMVRSALRELQKARDLEGIIDPAKAADETSKLLLQQLGEKIRLENELHIATRTLTATSPSVRVLKSRLEAVDRQVEELKQSLAGDSRLSRNIAASIRRFEELELQRQLSERLLSYAEDSLERARVRAERQGLYLMVFVPPSLPVKALYPKRYQYSALIFVGLAIIWSIVALIFASIKDHQY